MRKFLAVLLLILILVGLMPLVAGTLFKRNYLNLLSNITYANGSRIQVVDYSLGWLTSEAKIYLPLRNPNDKSADHADLPSGITIIQHIAHGPYLKNPITGAMSFSEAAIQSELHLDDKIEKMLLMAAANRDQGVMQINTVVSFFNNYLSQVETPALTFKTADNTLTWKGLTGSITADVANNHIANIESDFKSGAFTAQNDRLTLEMNSMASRGTRHCKENGICDGTASLSIPGITADKPSERIFKINNLNFDSSYDENNDYKSAIKIAMSGLSTNDYTINSAIINFNTSNLNVAKLKQLLDKTKSLEGAYNGDAQSQGLALMAEYNSDVPQLITAKSALTENARIVTSAGVISNDARLYWPKGVALPANTSDLLSNLAFSLNARATATLIDQVITQLDQDNTFAAPDNSDNGSAAVPVNIPPPSTQAETDFQKLMSTLILQKQLSETIHATLLGMETQQVTMREMSAYLQTQISSRALPFASGQAIKNAYQAVLDEKVDNIVDAIFATPSKRNKDIQIKIAALLQQKVIQPETEQGLIQLENQSLAPEIFALALHRFQASSLISADLEKKLNAQYAAINKELSINADKSVDAAAAADATAAAGPGQLGNMFADWLAKGYVKRDKDDYVVALTYEKQSLSLNGIAVNANQLEVPKVAPVVSPAPTPIPSPEPVTVPLPSSTAPVAAPILVPVPALVPAGTPAAAPTPAAPGRLSQPITPNAAKVSPLMPSVPPGAPATPAATTTTTTGQ